MKKSFVLKIVVLCVVISCLFNIFAGRFLAAKISTWPMLNRFGILSPQAPIVITNRETIRVSDSGDVIKAASDIKSKISTVVQINNGAVVSQAAAINLTSDGVFVTGATSFVKGGVNYYVLLNDGRSAKVTDMVTDLGTSLIFFKASLPNVPVANFANSKDISTGEKVLFAKNSLENFKNNVDLVYVNQDQSNISGQLFQSDLPSRGFSVQSAEPLVSGQALISTNSDILGIWNGNGIISSDVLKQAMNLYFTKPQKITRPSFGFSYVVISQNESKLTSQPEGYLVKDITGFPAKQAGILPGDIITSVGNQALNESISLEEILQQFRPQDKIDLTLFRKNQTVKVTLIVGELK